MNSAFSPWEWAHDLLDRTLTLSGDLANPENPLRASLVALTASVLTFFLTRFILKVVVHRLSIAARKTSTNVDDALVSLISKTHPAAILALAVFTGSRFLELSNRAENLISKGFVIFLIAQCAIWAHHGFAAWIAHLSKTRAQDGEGTTTILALGYLGKIVLWTLATLLTLDNLGINISALVTGLGIGGIAVALAVQNILGDLLASLSIVIDKPFVVGDFIVLENHMGTVEHVGLKSTRIRSLSGEQIIMSNNDLLKTRIRNFKRMSERRVVLVVGVVFNTSDAKLAAIPKIIKETILCQSNVRFERAHFRDIGTFALNFEAVYFVLSANYNDYMDVQEQINLALMSRFRNEQIEFAFPTQRVEVENIEKR